MAAKLLFLAGTLLSTFLRLTYCQPVVCAVSECQCPAPGVTWVRLDMILSIPPVLCVRSCVNNTDICPENTTCISEFGLRYCGCFPGFQIDLSHGTCMGTGSPTETTTSSSYAVSTRTTKVTTTSATVATTTATVSTIDTTVLNSTGTTTAPFLTETTVSPDLTESTTSPALNESTMSPALTESTTSPTLVESTTSTAPNESTTTSERALNESRTPLGLNESSPSTNLTESTAPPALNSSSVSRAVNDSTVPTSPARTETVTQPAPTKQTSPPGPTPMASIGLSPVATLAVGLSCTAAFVLLFIIGVCACCPAQKRPRRLQPPSTYPYRAHSRFICYNGSLSTDNRQLGYFAPVGDPGKAVGHRATATSWDSASLFDVPLSYENWPMRATVDSVDQLPGNYKTSRGLGMLRHHVDNDRVDRTRIQMEYETEYDIGYELNPRRRLETDAVEDYNRRSILNDNTGYSGDHPKPHYNSGRRYVNI